MKRKSAGPHAEYYVRSIPYAGDLPYLEIGLGDTRIYMNSDKQGFFNICTDLYPDISLKRQSDDGIFKQPDWAFLVSNGTDQLYLNTNAGDFRMTFRCTKSDIQIDSQMTEEEAKMLSTSFFQALGEKLKLEKPVKHKLKPLGIYYTYKVKCVTIDPR